MPIWSLAPAPPNAHYLRAQLYLPQCSWLLLHRCPRTLQVAENPRRRRYLYLWGGEDPQEALRRECLGLYRDDAAWLGRCEADAGASWGEQLAEYLFLLLDPTSGLGGAPLPPEALPGGVPVLKQGLEVLEGNSQPRELVAVRHLGQSAEAAAKAFCAASDGFSMEPFFSGCVSTLTDALRLESEVGIGQLPHLRMQ